MEPGVIAMRRRRKRGGNTRMKWFEVQLNNFTIKISHSFSGAKFQSLFGNMIVSHRMKTSNYLVNCK